MFHVGFVLDAPAHTYRAPLKSDKALYVRFAHAVLKRGVCVLERGAWFVSSAHDNDVIDATLEAAKGAASDIASAQVNEEGLKMKFARHVSIPMMGAASVMTALAKVPAMAADAQKLRAALIFQGVESEIIGDYGTPFGGPAGDEVDRFDSNAGTPFHALHLVKSEGIPVPAWAPADPVAHMRTNHEESEFASIVYFEIPSGGAVSSVGSMAYIGALNHNNCDNDMSRITRNVLKRFTNPAPFRMLRA